jgi:hypothetical protein
VNVIDLVMENCFNSMNLKENEGDEKGKLSDRINKVREER